MLEDYILTEKAYINKNITPTIKKAPSYCKHRHTSINKGNYIYKF